MNKTFVLIIILAVVIGGAIYLGHYRPDIEDQTRDAGNEILVSSWTSFMGRADKVTVYTDRKFKHEDEDRGLCVESSISEDDYSSLESFLRSSGIVDMKITQRDEWGLICEGGPGIKILVDGKENRLSPPCLGGEPKNTQTREVLSLMGNIYDRLYDLISKYPTEVCLMRSEATNFSVPPSAGLQPSDILLV